MVALSKFGICILLVLLSGCAGAPQSSGVRDDGYDVASVRESDSYKAARKAARNSRSSLSTQSRVNKVDPQSQRCLAMVLYWEARGEGRQGMVAVGSVVMNRVADHRFPDSVCAVVYQGGESPPCQFSWWCDGKSDYPSQRQSWVKATNVANNLLTARPKDPTDGALFFHNTSIRNPWDRNLTARIGNHIFYR
jgi:N-acetylmuramoyl-L-alanine amidase